MPADEYRVIGVPDSTISSVRIAIQGGHARISIWNRGALAGEIVVEAKDADDVVNRLTNQRRTSWERITDTESSL